MSDEQQLLGAAIAAVAVANAKLDELKKGCGRDVANGEGVVETMYSTAIVGVHDVYARLRIAQRYLLERSNDGSTS